MCNLGRPFCTSNNLTSAIWDVPFAHQAIPQVQFGNIHFVCQVRAERMRDSRWGRSSEAKR